MPGTIGSITVDSFGLSLQEGAPTPRTEVEVKDGSGLTQRQSFPPIPRSVSGPTVADYATYAAAVTDADAYRAMVGTVISITDQHGTVWAGCFIEDVVAVPTKILGALGRINAQWKVLVADA